MNPLVSQKTRRGFTLIELLVVIAIIGILSAVVLGSLALGRQKAYDAAIKSDVHTIQSQMEIYFSNNNTYGTTLAANANPTNSVPGLGTSAYIVDASINGALKAALAQTAPVVLNNASCGGATSGGGTWATGVNGATWAVNISLKANKCQYWCVDSTGSSKTYTNSFPAIGGGGAAATCP